jgi:hypothetical protein
LKHNSSPFCRQGLSNCLPRRPQTAIFPISTSQVIRIIGMNTGPSEIYHF